MSISVREGGVAAGVMVDLQRGCLTLSIESARENDAVSFATLADATSAGESVVRERPCLGLLISFKLGTIAVFSSECVRFSLASTSSIAS